MARTWAGGGLVLERGPWPNQPRGEWRPDPELCGVLPSDPHPLALENTVEIKVCPVDRRTHRCRCAHGGRGGQGALLPLVAHSQVWEMSQPSHVPPTGTEVRPWGFGPSPR